LDFVFPVLRFQIPCSGLANSLFLQAGFGYKTAEFRASRAKATGIGQLEKIANSLLVPDNREFLRKNRPPVVVRDDLRRSKH
jgi:hypothetical protein